MIYEENFDFSFSGLKTAVLRQVQKKRLSLKQKSELAFEIQEAISDVLVFKTKKAVAKYQVKSLLLAGGVIANPRLRKKIAKELPKYMIPKRFNCIKKIPLNVNGKYDRIKLVEILESLN